MNRPSNHNADTQTLVLHRTFSGDINGVSTSFTESDRLSRWYGTGTGDPSTGSVMVAVNAEPGEPKPARFEITACEPPALESFESDYQRPEPTA